MERKTIEGTWEEIARRAEELAGHRVRITVLDALTTPDGTGIPDHLLALQRAQGIPLMAYSPIDQSALAHHDTLAQVGRRIGATAAQVALAWTLRDGGVVAIPKALVKSHLRDNLQAASLTLDAADLALIDRAFPPPRRRRALAMN